MSRGNDSIRFSPLVLDFRPRLASERAAATRVARAQLRDSLHERSERRIQLASVQGL